MDVSKKKIIIADLDGTLAETKQELSEEMGIVIGDLLRHIDFAVISGASFKQIEGQFAKRVKVEEKFMSRLYLLPTSGASMYRFDGGRWIELYAERLREDEKAKIIASINSVLKEPIYKKPDKIYGKLIEDRDTEIAISALGQDAPANLKKAWDPDMRKRFVMKAELDKLIPEYEVMIGGSTSLDITRKGMNKGYGIRRITETLGYNIDEMLFFGDKIVEGGNDYPVKLEGVECINVDSVDHTIELFRGIKARLEGGA